MKFTINVQDLQEGLSTVTRALAARPAKQILDGVLIVADDNRLTLTCSDGSFSIEYTNAADVKESGQAVLPGKLLTEMIRKLPGGEVTLAVQNNRLANIRCLKNHSNISVMDAAEYPEITPVKNGAEVRIQQDKLKDMISRVMFAMATDESRQILTGCLMEVSRTEARLVALDGFRLGLRKLFQPFDLPDGKEVVKAIIPGKVITEMSRILPDDEAFCRLMVGDGRFQCEFGNIRMYSVLLGGEYIDYRRILPTEFGTEIKANRVALLEAMDRASLMAREGKNNLIRMSIRDGLVKITSNADLGDVEEEVEISLIGKELDIAFNAKYIIDVIRSISEDEVVLKFNTNVSPCVVTPKEGDDYVYLILPVRVF